MKTDRWSGGGREGERKPGNDKGWRASKNTDSARKVGR